LISADGDPDEMIDVPMVVSVEKLSMKRLLTGKKTIEQKVAVRKMKRSHYLKHYAKDSHGDYIGTEAPAHDASLVYVPSRSSKAEIQEQVKGTAFSHRHHNADDFGSTRGGFVQ
jgi:hypothetical protein